MANVTPVNGWSDGIYQFEVTDALQGGPDGKDNLPNKQAAGNFVYLKTRADEWDTFKGTGPGDLTSLKALVGNYKGVLTTNAGSAVFYQGDEGKVAYVTQYGAAFPSVANLTNVPVGAKYTVICGTSFPVAGPLILSQSAGGIMIFETGTTDGIRMRPGQKFEAVHLGNGQLLVAKSASPERSGVIGVTMLWSHNAASRPAESTGWLYCDGRTLNNADFIELYAVIGIQYGAGAGSTFKLPNSNGYIIKAF